jgi:hypothetical protein
MGRLHYFSCFLFLLCVAAYGESNPYASQMGVFGALGRDEVSLLSYRGTYTGYAPVTGELSTSNIFDNSASAMAPLFHSRSDLLFAKAGGDITDVGGLVIMPLTGLVVPSYLYSVQGNLGYTHRVSDRESFGIMGGLGTATNAPFQSFTEAVWNGTLFYTVPTGKTDQWVFLISDTNNRPGLAFLPQWVPLPGIEYIWRASSSVTATIGIPFVSFHANFYDFRFDAGGSFSFAHVKLIYQKWEAAQPYIAFDWDQHSYLLRPRVYPDDRFIYNEMKGSVGIQFPIYKIVKGDINGGYGFNRSFRMQSLGQTIDQAYIQPSWEASLKISLSFDDYRKARRPAEATSENEQEEMSFLPDAF